MIKAKSKHVNSIKETKVKKKEWKMKGVIDIIMGYGGKREGKKKVSGGSL